MKRMKMIVLVGLMAAAACAKQQEPAAQKAAAAVPAATGKDVQVVGRRIDIAVNKTGYQPDKVTVGKGEQVTLVFTRVEPTECGQEIAVPALGVKQQLPLNEPVAVVLKRDEAGEVGFACGMDMMKGTIVVQ